MRYIAKVHSLKGEKEQCLVKLADHLSLPLRKRTGKAGRLPGCRVRERANAARLVSGVGLAAIAAGKVRAVPLALGKAGAIAVGKVHAAPSALVLAPVNTGAYPRNCWHCALRPQKWHGSSLSPAGARSRTKSACHNCVHCLIARVRNSLI